MTYHNNTISNHSNDIRQHHKLNPSHKLGPVYSVSVQLCNHTAGVISTLSSGIGTSMEQLETVESCVER